MWIAFSVKWAQNRKSVMVEASDVLFAVNLSSMHEILQSVCEAPVITDNGESRKKSNS